MGRRDRWTATGGKAVRLAAVALVLGVVLAPAGAARAQGGVEVHVVGPGETLVFVAVAHDVALSDLASANGLDPAADIEPGHELVIPAWSGPAAASYTFHTVVAGDTVASIAAAYGVGIAEVIAANGIAEVEDLRIGLQLVIPLPEGSQPVAPVADDHESSASTAVLIAGVPTHRQQRSLSCEYAAVYIATSVFGAPIYEGDYYWSTPQSANPHYGFRGNIDGVWGNTDDYGIYAEALVPTLNAFGYVGEVSYGAEAAVLRGQLDLGRPVVVFLGYWGETGFYETDETGSYKLVAGYHSVVAYGYDEGGVYVSNPGQGTLEYYGWDWFLDAWSVMDGMALAVYPMA